MNAGNPRLVWMLFIYVASYYAACLDETKRGENSAKPALTGFGELSPESG
jgi:hypothetical protein